MTATDPLVKPLTEIVIELAWLLECSIDADGEPRAAAKTLDWIAFVLDHLTPDQRERLAGVVSKIAAEADPGERQRYLTAFPEAFGLVDDGGE
ncbi:hypothetical protein LN042_12660 [Kitasatospora sp. RB6PN24]|uniref:hypothetical protein n=1 Tax=Kitasatospora humi TaxID=2893891 RepID=UPI001E330B03|nr:hypothetical protein [Kitasatospora humi]MCC9307933.1 hypothetical protein [Kitasatospora humi]